MTLAGFEQERIQVLTLNTLAVSGMGLPVTVTWLEVRHSTLRTNLKAMRSE